MILRTLRGCSPFIACGLISSFTEWRIGTLVAVVLSAALMIGALRGGDGVDGAVIEISAVVFCGAAAVIAFGAPQLGIRGFIGALSNGWLALTAWGTVVLGRPFTKATERRRVAEAVWRHPAFHRTHAVMTSVWALGFTATAVVLVVVEYLAPHSGLVEILVQLVGNLVPAAFVYRYQTDRRRNATAHGEQPRPGSAPTTAT